MGWEGFCNFCKLTHNRNTGQFIPINHTQTWKALPSHPETPYTDCSHSESPHISLPLKNIFDAPRDISSYTAIQLMTNINNDQLGGENSQSALALTEVGIMSYDDTMSEIV